MAQKWVGRYYEKTLVFDSDWKSETSNFVLFWDANDLLFALYPRSMARRRIHKADPAVTSEAITDFERWVTKNTVSLSDLTKLRDEATFLALNGDMTQAERQELHLIKFGTPYKHRVTHCWNCAKPLSTATNQQCAICTWLICTCGECNCSVLENFL